MDRMSSKTVALLYMRGKQQEMMSLAMAFKPEDAMEAEEYEDALNVFIELTSYYTAFTSAIDMIETVQKDIYKAQVVNAKLTRTNSDLLREIKEKNAIIEKLQERVDL